jgi:hypothetical protein
MKYRFNLISTVFHIGESIGAICSVLELNDRYLFKLKYDKKYYENVRILLVV